MRFNLIQLFIVAGLLSACSKMPELTQDNVVGENISAMSSMNSDQVSDSAHVHIYDKTVHQIHHFNVTDMTLIDSWKVADPDQDHSVIAPLSGAYVIDLTKKGVTIFTSRSQTGIKNPLKMLGTPISAAYSEKQGVFIVYDDIGTVGILKLNDSGAVLGKAVLGSDLISGGNIVAGDLTSDGKLIMALKTGDIATVDVNQTISTGEWSYQLSAAKLTGILWLAPLKDTPSQVLARTATKLQLIDVVAGTVIDEVIPAGSVWLTSKSVSPHVVFRDGNFANVYYVNAGKIVSKSVRHEDNVVIKSFLDTSKGTWSFIRTRVNKNIWNAEEITEGREFYQYRLSDLLAMDSQNLLDKATVQITHDFIFSLMPSELGYAIRNEIGTGTKTELRYFNVKPIGDL